MEPVPIILFMLLLGAVIFIEKANNELLAYTQSELFRCVMEFLACAVKTTEEESNEQHEQA